MLKKVIVLSALLFAVGSLFNPANAKPDEATDAQVQNCQFLSEVTSSSGYGKNSGWKSIAKVRAESKAGSIGATHIVWSNFRDVGAFNGEATARAYDCRR
jgi:hypothetical protein